MAMGKGKPGSSVEGLGKPPANSAQLPDHFPHS